MLANLVIGLEKDRFRTLVHNAESQTDLALEALTVFRTREVTVMVAVPVTNKVMGRCETSATGIGKAP